MTTALNYPPAPVGVLVCCHCRRPLTVHRFLCESHPIETFHCPQHGNDTTPMRSVVVNRGTE